MPDTSVAILKRDLRSKMLVQRREYALKERENDSLLLFEKLSCQELFIHAQKILLTISLDDEVSTRRFLESMSETKQLFVPVTRGDELVPVPYSKATKLTLGAYGIYEPAGQFAAKESYKFDLVLVPAVAVDRSGNRLGMGKGYFDRFLKKCHATTIATVFDFQVVDKVPTDNYDIPVSFVLTPHHFFPCKQISTFPHS